jgi:hypothetical protein
VVSPLAGALYPAVVPVAAEFTIASGRLHVGVVYYGPNDGHAFGLSIHRVLSLKWAGRNLANLDANRTFYGSTAAEIARRHSTSHGVNAGEWFMV